ncbi:PAS domain S-box protein [Cyanobacteria bacterium FACHB-502]|nr:PAS domain S-box protein [Cyanobacteria bacterium FACHB-502]
MTSLPSPSSLQFQTLQESLLHRITNRIRQSLQLQEILQTTVTEIRAFLETDRVVVYRFYSDEHGEVIAEAIHQDRLPSLLGLHFPADDIPAEARERFLQARQRSIVDLSTAQIGWSQPRSIESADRTSDDIHYRPIDPCHAEYLKAMGVQSSVVVPIVQTDQLWGLLVAHHAEPRPISEAELHFLQLVVDQVTIAIAQSALLVQVQTQAFQERTANQIATLLHGEAANPFEAALKATVEVIGGVGGRLLLLPSAVGQASELYCCGTQPVQVSFAPDSCLEQEPLWQAALLSPKLMIADLVDDPRCQSLHQRFQDTPIRSLLIMPLHGGAETIGCLTLFRDEIETETLWAGRIEPDGRQTMPRQSFKQWRQHKPKQAQAWTETDLNVVKAIRIHFALAVARYQLQTQVHALNTSLKKQVQHQSRDLANIQSALDQSSIVAMTDPQGMICYVNDRFCEISKYNRNELIGQSYHLLRSEHHPKEFFSQMWQTIDSGAIWRGEVKNRARDGTEYWVDKTIVPLLDEQGKPYQYVAIESDITARKQVEAALRYQSSLLQNVIDSSTDWIFVKDLDFRYLLANQTYLSAIDRKPEDIIGKDDLELGFPPDQVFGNPEQETIGFRVDDQKAIAGEIVLNLGEPVTVADGTVVWMETKKLPLRDQEGRIFGVLGVCTDITQRRQAETTLKRTTERLQEAQRVAQMGSWEYDVATGTVNWSDELFRVFGMEPRATAPSLEEHAQIFHPDDWKWFQQTFDRAIHEGIPYDVEIRFFHPNGSTHLINAKAEIVNNDAGQITALFGTVMDITDRKQAEATLQEQLNLAAFRADVDASLTRGKTLQDMLQYCTEAMVSHLGAAFARVWLLNAQENILELKASSGLYTHLDGDHARVPVGKFKIGLIAEECQPHLTNSVLDDPRVGNKEWAKQEKMVAFAGYPLMVENQLLGVMAMFARQPLSFSTLDALALVSQEIALGIKRQYAEMALRQSEVELREKAQQLEQALHELQHTQAQLVQTEKMSSLGQLVAGVAHEINNPVNFIYGNLAHVGGYAYDLLNLLDLYHQYYPVPVPAIAAEAEKIDLAFLKVDLPKLLTSMKVGADRIQKIVLALRTFSRMDEAEVKAVNIHEGIDSTLMILQSRLKETAGHWGIQVVKAYGNLPLIECYAGQLNQVFMNILSNAIDALDEFNSTRSPQEIQNHPAAITIKTQQIHSHRIQIRIADNGIGMSEQVQQRLFEPFFTTKPIGKGTGLGLSISYQVVVDKHGGLLTCHSALDQGTEFVIELPLALESELFKS